MEILQHNMDWDDIEPAGLALRIIAKLDNPLRDLELTDLNSGLPALVFSACCGSTDCDPPSDGTSSARSCALFEYSCGHIGNREPNSIEHIGPTNEGAGLKIGEELVKPDQGRLI